MSVAEGKKERFHFLDGLRGIASILIVVHHAFKSNIVKVLHHFRLSMLEFYFPTITQSGVELFFVLSGVVLLRPYLRGQREFHPVDYFQRRFKRIYPTYFTALVFASAVVWFISAYPTWYNIKGMHIPFTWAGAAKQLFIFNMNDQYYNMAWWSLQVEILFYLIVPIIIVLFPPNDKFNYSKFILCILGTMAVSISLQVYSTEHTPLLYSYKNAVLITPIVIQYPLCFLMGIYLAKHDFNIRQGYIFIAWGLLLIAGAYFYFPLINAGYGMLYAGLITLIFRIGSLKRILSKPIMIWLGERSYSLFLIHFSVFYLVDNLTGHFTTHRGITYGLLSRGVGVPLAFLAAMTLFYFVERKQARGLVTANMFWPWQVKSIKGSDLS